MIFPAAINNRIIPVLLFVFAGIGWPVKAQNYTVQTVQDIAITDSAYQRILLPAESFGSWLRNLVLKPETSPVLNYKGKIHKSAADTTVARVIALDLQGRRNEQCMDILIRFYAEYLWQTKQADDLSLPLPGGIWFRWIDWRAGLRPEFNGIHMKLKSSAETDSSFQNYENYLRMIYAESHTQQFYHELRRVDPGDLQVGDFIVSKGSKSHAVMIVDLARNRQGQWLALFGQGDTPACEFYILQKQKSEPWFPLNFDVERIPLPIKRHMKWEGLRRFNRLQVSGSR
jgi:hypothetical protein